MNSDDTLTGGSSIARRVAAALQADRALGRLPIAVSDEGATVTLTGQVGSPQDKEAAERLARSVDSVINVTNELTIARAGDQIIGSRGAPAGAGAVTGLPPLAPGPLAASGSSVNSPTGPIGAGPAAAPLAGPASDLAGGGASSDDQDAREVRFETGVDDANAG